VNRAAVLAKQSIAVVSLRVDCVDFVASTMPLETVVVSKLTVQPTGGEY